MDARSKKAWGFVAITAFAVLVLARKMLKPDMDAPVAPVPDDGSPGWGIVTGGKNPVRGQLYGVRRSPTHVHQGVDIFASKGSNIYAAQQGIVAARWPDGVCKGYGNTIVLQHPDGTQTLYAHMDSFAPGLRKGHAVIGGQLIGHVGQTQKPRAPMVTPPHVHFETHLAHTLRIREDSPPRMDPLDYLAERGLTVAA